MGHEMISAIATRAWFGRLQTLTMSAVLALTASMASPAQAATFILSPLDLGGGYTLAGSVRTDGTRGSLSAANITGWSLKVTAINYFVYTPANTRNISRGLIIDGGKLIVDANVGGALAFRSTNRVQVSVADFLGDTRGNGLSRYVFGGSFDERAIRRPADGLFVAANASAPGSSVYDIVSRRFPSGTTMLGSITTDGNPVSAALTDWTVIIREVITARFNPLNSSVLADAGLYTDGRTMSVSALDPFDNPGSFLIGGTRAGDFNGVLLGDFTSDPGGAVGYISPTTYQVTSPLPLDMNNRFVLATAGVPEPAVWLMMLTGFLAVGSLLRRTRRAAPTNVRLSFVQQPR